ncbi:hypothetical protein FEV53_03385 [Palleronia caenipelagi]|uniref:Tyr recombinase domain-containing protein n=2 Tax=Palleronia caenipelagi TaxID=2489174 RepID=A0A547Q8X0_9RHOB|nr:hypothetical protein FEV53_03385 [Palleronia caenipelagi]
MRNRVWSRFARSEVLAVQINLSVLVEQLANVFGCKRRKTDPIHEETWRIAALETPHGDVTLRLIHDRNARALTNALSREARSAWRLIVTAEGALSLPDVTTVALKDLIEIDAGTGALRAIAELAVLCGVPEIRRGGTRRPWRSSEPVRKIVNDALKAAGLQAFGPHAFRHLHARNAAKTCTTPVELVAVSQNLGHTDVLTTLRSYGQITRERQHAIVTGEPEVRGIDDWSSQSDRFKRAQCVGTNAGAVMAYRPDNHQ